MTFQHLLLIGATLLCGVTTGFVFAFAAVVMPGIRNLPDRDFLRSFQVMDRVIQNNNPWFVTVWVRSVLLLIAACVVNVPQLSGWPRPLLLAALAVYLLAVQLPTGVVNVPLNNQLQKLELDRLNGEALADARDAFEPRWVFWNAFRTIAGIVATTMLLIVSQAS